MVAVFHAAPHRVEAKHVDHSVLPSVPKAWCPKPLMVVAPANARTYPVAIFLHGCNMVNSWKVACWAADERQGLAYVLGSVLNLPSVKPDLSRLALAA
ncbi:hypothetical protein OsI_06779 [Oryza sativa Indica Group]|uniref:Chlorophyllase n=1 Tax=Oryza sativa subsp. indica TaxID=39946 RepID=B8AFN1_ORYSI|nr:hypothetical protein OsI_06779 [Oryza sativa Indica Group]